MLTEFFNNLKNYLKVQYKINYIKKMKKDVLKIANWHIIKKYIKILNENKVKLIKTKKYTLDKIVNIFQLINMSAIKIKI